MDRVKKELKRVDKLCNKYHLALMIACELLDTYCDPEEFKLEGNMEAYNLTKRFKRLLKDIKHLEVD